MFLNQRILLYSLFLLTILSTFINVLVPSNMHFIEEPAYLNVVGGALILIFLFIFLFKRIQTDINLIDIIMFIYLLYQIVHVIIFNRRGVDSYFVLPVITILSYYIFKNYFINEQNSQSANNYFIVTILVLNLIPLVFAILEYTQIISKYDESFPIYGGFTNPGICANYIAILIPFSFVVLWQGKNKLGFVFILSAFTFTSSVILLLILYSRTSWIAAFIAILYVVLSTDNKFVQLIKKLLSSSLKKGIFIFLLGSVILVSSYFLYNLKKESANGRRFIWSTCINMIKDKPIWGRGYSTYIKTFNDYQINYFINNPDDLKNVMNARSATVALNDYLQSATETGIVGFLLLAGLIVLVFRTKTKTEQKKNNFLFTASKASILSMLFCGFSSYTFRTASTLMIFFVFIAYVSSYANSTTSMKKITGKLKVPGLIILAVVFIYAEYFQITELNNSLKWEKAYSKVNSSEYNSGMELYKQIYPGLKNNFLFLFNYGTLKSRYGEAKESNEILEHAKTIATTYDLFIYLGNNYACLNNYTEAEKNYLSASNLIPYMFVPKQKLLKLYIKTNQTDKAIKIANQINNMPVKVYSTLVGQIKNEAIEYLNSKNHKFTKMDRRGNNNNSQFN